MYGAHEQGVFDGEKKALEAVKRALIAIPPVAVQAFVERLNEELTLALADWRVDLNDAGANLYRIDI